mmetsp:Transcript_19208/g.53772  ORF Transcript_19208/g.53772 Transcript_19208/m.53772 type:complete len:87 (-) Transcript_19208:1875-2135(-)
MPKPLSQDTFASNLHKHKFNYLCARSPHILTSNCTFARMHTCVRSCKHRWGGAQMQLNTYTLSSTARVHMQTRKYVHMLRSGHARS